MLERKRCKGCAPGESIRRSSPKPKPREPKGHKQLPAMSKRRAGQVDARRSVNAEVVARDGACIPAAWGAPGQCLGPLHAHELEKRSQRRDAHLDPSNCVAACSFHNGWIEDHPLDAHALGLVIRRGDPGSTR